MMTDFRALCAELLDWAEVTAAHYIQLPDVLLRARAALADEPAVPEGREPAAVTGQLSDEELLNLAQQYSVVYLLSDGSACHPFQEGYDMRNDVLNFARAVLTRWGHQPAPPADGEVAELTGQLVEAANGAAAMGWDQHAQRILRAAELLQRHVVVPVAVSERLPEAGDCDAEGRCWWRSHAVGGPYWHLWHRQRWTPIDTHWLPAHALPLPEVSE